MHEDSGQRMFLWARQLHVILWKNIYLKRICRHYAATLIECGIMVILLLGIQEVSVAREPMVRRPDTVYRSIHPNQFWNTQPDMARIRTVYFAPDNRYVRKLTRDAFARLGVNHVIAVPTKQQLVVIAQKLANATPPVRAVALHFQSIKENDTKDWPVKLHVSLFAGRLPFDIQLHYQQSLVAQPEGPVKEELFPEVNTLLPVIGTLQQRHLELQAHHLAYPHPLPRVTLQRFPYPTHIEYKDTKNYALVLTRFVIGMLIPFAVCVVRLAEEKSTGMKEMMRLVGLNDWLYWGSHYLTGFVIHLFISTVMLLFMTVKKNDEGRPFILYSDPTLLFLILMCFCSSCRMHAMLLSTFLGSPHSAVAGALLYWTISCSMPFLALEHDNGQGYYYIQREYKLFSSVFPGMSLHWSFRVLERFEKFVENGANWSNFYDMAATPDNITLAEIVFVNLLADCFIICCIWYLDNVHPIGPAIPKPLLFPLKKTYWIPNMTIGIRPDARINENNNFQQEPKDKRVAIDLVNVCKDYDGVIAANEVNLRIYEKQVTVLLGHNGSGKTTLLNLVTGFADCSSGQVIVGGYDIKTCTRDARESMGYCPKDDILFDDLTVEEHVMFFALLKGIPRKRVRLYVGDLLDDVGLTVYKTALPSQMPLGEQRRLSVALAILGTPKIIVMDEPTANMDNDGRSEILQLLLKMRRSSTILLSTAFVEEADVLGDRIAVMAHGKIRCVGSPAFLKRRFNAGYHLHINKCPKSNIRAITTLLQKHAPNAKLRCDTINEVVFTLGHAMSTQSIITMFMDIETSEDDLGIESIGMSMTSLEDVLIMVGDAHHVHDRPARRPSASGSSKENIGDEPPVLDAKPSVVKEVVTNRARGPTLAGRVRAMFVKRSILVWRDKKMLLFSWAMPLLLLTLLFGLEQMALSSIGYAVEQDDNTLEYTFPGVFLYSQGFQQADTEEAFLSKWLRPLFCTDHFGVKSLDAGIDITKMLLEISKRSLGTYVFRTHFVIQVTNKTGAVLWYNGEIRHMAALITTLYNTARLQSITGSKESHFSFEVTQPVLENLAQLGATDQYKRQSTYRYLLTKVLYSVGFPLYSSLMCSTFVLFPITERALQVKHLHIITGMSHLLYWLINFTFDFLFYLSTALLVLPPVAFLQRVHVTSDDLKLIFMLNFILGYAALPVVYICSFLFSKPGNGFSFLAIAMFTISSAGCLGEVFMDHYTDHGNSTWWVPIIKMALRVSWIVPSTSYSRGMTKIIQLAHENRICAIGGTELRSRCRNKVARHQLSLWQCCQQVDAEIPVQYAIRPLDVHPYSAFYEVLSLSIEGVVAFAILLIIESMLPRISRYRSQPPNKDYDGIPEKTSPTANALKGPAKMKLDTEVLLEEKLVGDLVAGVSPPSSQRTLLMVDHLYKAYRQHKYHPVLQGLSFTVRAGECFGLLAVDGVGKSTTFRILAGELLPHKGDAYISGFSLVRETQKFCRNIGYCPETDGLLEMMTGMETLVLFGRLKGVAITPQYLQALLEIFHLGEYADQLVGTYSRRTRRKLSVCIAMLGLPRLVLLDEPLAGIGSTARRIILNYIAAFQRVANVSFIIGSHSMSEVESVCDRIGIMDGGRLQCLGSLKKLQHKFGKGYTIAVKTLPDRRMDKLYQLDVYRAINLVFPHAELIHTYENLLEFRVYQVGIPWSEMFTRMARIKKRFKLQDFFITDASLEQIFLSVTRRQVSEAAAEAAAADARRTSTVGVKFEAGTLKL